MSDSTMPENTGADIEADSQETSEPDWKALARKWESRAKASRAEADANRDAAKRLAELEEAAKSTEQKQAEKLSKMEAELNGYRMAEKRAGWVKEVIAEVSLPSEYADVLRGDSREAIQEHAESLKALIEPKGTPVPNAGKTPETKSTPEREAVRNLFGPTNP